MNNQAAQTIPSWVQERELIRAVLCKELDTNIESDERTYTIAVRAANALHWRQAEIDQLKAQVAALSQPAGVPFGHAMFNAEGKCIGFRQNTGFGYNFTVADFLRADKIMPHGAPHTGCLVYAAAPAASGGDHYNGVTQPDGSGFRHGDNSVGALPEALPKPQVANPADTTYPSPPSGASQSSNPNPVTPGLSSESGASVSDRAREILGSVYRKAHDADPSINFCTPEWNVALAALEQALTQQHALSSTRQEGEGKPFGHYFVWESGAGQFIMGQTNWALNQSPSR
jgi:hypothetical protein